VLKLKKKILRLKVKSSWRFLDTFSITEFQENTSSGSRVVPCKETDGHDELLVAFRDFENWPKKICNVLISPTVKQKSLLRMHAPYAMRLGFIFRFNYCP